MIATPTPTVAQTSSETVFSSADLESTHLLLLTSTGTSHSADVSIFTSTPLLDKTTKTVASGSVDVSITTNLPSLDGQVILVVSTVPAILVVTVVMVIFACGLFIRRYDNKIDFVKLK